MQKNGKGLNTETKSRIDGKENVHVSVSIGQVQKCKKGFT